MNADTVPNSPLAQAILNALVDSRAGQNYYDDTRLILGVLEKQHDLRWAARETLLGRVVEWSVDGGPWELFITGSSPEGLTVGMSLARLAAFLDPARVRFRLATETR